MKEIKEGKIKEIIYDDKNFNKHTEKGMELKWDVKLIQIANLIEWGGNPRKISRENFEFLKGSFKKFGHARTLTVSPIGDNRYEIIGGNQSKKALEELGYKEINCNVSNRMLTENEKRELSIKLNHTNKGEGEMEKVFKPYGYTYLALLSESHFAIHTFPEHKEYYIELSSCVKEPFDKFINYLC